MYEGIQYPTKVNLTLNLGNLNKKNPNKKILNLFSKNRDCDTFRSNTQQNVLVV